MWQARPGLAPWLSGSPGSFRASALLRLLAAEAVWCSDGKSCPHGAERPLLPSSSSIGAPGALRMPSPWLGAGAAMSPRPGRLVAATAAQQPMGRPACAQQPPARGRQALSRASSPWCHNQRGAARRLALRPGGDEAPAGSASGRSGSSQAARAASIAAVSSAEAGSTPLLKRASTVPSLPTRNFSKFQATSPAGSTWVRVM